MRRITDAEKKAWKAELQQRQTPAEMTRRWQAFHDEIGPQMLVQAGVEFMRDGYVAHRFANSRAAQAVWLVSEARPDFGVLLDDGEFLFEVTEADWPDRRRGREYKEDIIPKLLDGTAKVEHDTDRFRMTPEQARGLLRRAAEEKRDRGYNPTSGLVILLQPGSWSSESPAIEAVMADATESAKSAFREIWVDWKARFYLVWRDGEQTSSSI